MSTKNDEANTTDTCENCSTSFNLFKRKKICTVCNQAFCQYCVSRLPQSARSSSRICNTCKTICAPQSTIDDLLNIKVKHLRSVLSTSSIPTNTCKEKRDLVDLFFRNREKFDQFSSRPVTNNNNNINNNNNNNNINNINNSNNMHSSANGNQQQSFPLNDTFNSFINNVQGFVSSNLGSVLNGSAVPCPPPPNRTQHNRSNHNTSSSSASSTSSQNFNTMFNIFGEQIPNVFSHFNVNSETNAQSQPPPTQSQPRSTEPRSQPQSQASQPMQSEPSQSQSTTKRRASLTDLKCPEDIDHLSIKQIKEILANNFVEYKGCCERSELVDKLKRLFVSDCENKRREQQLNNPSTSNDSRLNSEETDVCKICMESIMDCVLLDCGHMCSCIKCGKQLAECPICRQNVVRVVRVFKS